MPAAPTSAGGASTTTGQSSFGSRLREAIRDRSPFCLGVDPTASLLAGWGLGDDVAGLRRFCAAVDEAVGDRLAVVKPQSAYFERHGSAGVAILEDFCAAVHRRGVLVILDVKRGDIGSTAAAYAEAYVGEHSLLHADAMTVLPYMGMGAIASMVDVALGAGAGLFVVTRSSNPEGREIQTAATGTGTVEGSVVEAIAAWNATAPAGALGSIGAVFAANQGPAPGIDLAAMNGPFLVPGLGFQGGSYDEVGTLFAGCSDRLVVSASRSVLAHGPDPAALAEEIIRQQDLAFGLRAAP